MHPNKHSRHTTRHTKKLSFEEAIIRRARSRRVVDSPVSHETMVEELAKAPEDLPQMVHFIDVGPGLLS